MIKSCKTCRYCDDFDRVCQNWESPHAYEFTFYTEPCNKWEERKDNDTTSRSNPR